MVSRICCIVLGVVTHRLSTLFFSLDGLGHGGNAGGQARSFGGRSQHELGIRPRHQALQGHVTQGPQLILVQGSEAAQAAGRPAL